jgi:copper homeostasis protein
MPFQLEVIAFTIESLKRAEKSGAHRIELCDNPPEGGTTASKGMIRKARELSSLQLYPIIRPRGGDFLYNDEEFQVMKEDILWCKEVGCDGVVIGLLNSDGTIDSERSARLVECAYPLGVTFHRAFDRVVDPYEAMEDLIRIGCERVLTSGGRPTAMEGLFVLNQLVRQADERIIIMPGSGVRAKNIIEIAKQTGAREFHTSARKQEESKMDYLNPDMKETLSAFNLDEEEVKSTIDSLEIYFGKNA